MGEIALMEDTNLHLSRAMECTHASCAAQTISPGISHSGRSDYFLNPSTHGGAK